MCIKITSVAARDSIIFLLLLSFLRSVFFFWLPPNSKWTVSSVGCCKERTFVDVAIQSLWTTRLNSSISRGREIIGGGIV